MRIGITGSQHGGTASQEAVLVRILAAVHFVELHHGDCVGVDALAHRIVSAGQAGPGEHATVVIHPPSNPGKRAFCAGFHGGGSVKLLEPKPYLERDGDIVRDTDILIAVPASAAEQQRSGTWATIRYAERLRRLILIINPDGTISVG
jgi:hypothetical protein